MILLAARAAVSDDHDIATNDLSALTQMIENKSSLYVERDQRSNVVSVTCPVDYATDANLSLLSTAKELRNLTLLYGSPPRRPSSAGVRSLKGALSLRSLTLECGGTLPNEVFESLASLGQLEVLNLVRAFPTDLVGYRVLSGLTNLKRLTIWYPGTLGPEQAGALAELRELRDIQIYRGLLREADFQRLISQPGLTNLLIEGGTWSLHLTREVEARR